MCCRPGRRLLARASVLLWRLEAPTQHVEWCWGRSERNQFWRGEVSARQAAREACSAPHGDCEGSGQSISELGKTQLPTPYALPFPACHCPPLGKHGILSIHPCFGKCCRRVLRAVRVQAQVPEVGRRECWLAWRAAPQNHPPHPCSRPPAHVNFLNGIDWPCVRLEAATVCVNVGSAHSRAACRVTAFHRTCMSSHAIVDLRARFIPSCPGLQRILRGCRQRKIPCIQQAGYGRLPRL